MAASIITQVSQGGGGGGLSNLGVIGSDESVTLDLRGTRFVLSRDELLTLPEFVLLSLFPNGILPDSHMNFLDSDVHPVDVSNPRKRLNPKSIHYTMSLLHDPNFHTSDFYIYESQYDPVSLQFMLDFFRVIAQTIPTRAPSPNGDSEAVAVEPMPGSARDMLQGRAGIIVLREDLDYYVIPPRADVDAHEMLEIKRAAGQALLKQNGIFSGLRKSDDIGSTEQHLIEMLTAGGFDPDARWGHRASEPKKAVVCSIALARHRDDIEGDTATNNMSAKLLLFWRKPARRCWWEGVQLDNVDGVNGKLKVWVRRVWTLEMSVIGLR